MTRLMSKKIAFVGAGRMAEALLEGLLVSECAEPERLAATDVSADRRELVKRRFGVRALSDNAEAVAWADVVVLAVKPQQVEAVMDSIAAGLAGRLLVSIAAGVPIDRLTGRVPADVRVVRVMPNAPALVREGMSAVAFGQGILDEDRALVLQLFEAVGRVVTVEERLMDAVTGLSGSGPAYACLAIEALADGGVKMGLPRNVAEMLAAQTMLGAARMLLVSGEHPARLKDRVASPGGTTMAGLHQLEHGRLRATLIAAVEAAAKRAEELGR